MGLRFTPEENAFRDEVRAFLRAALPESIRRKDGRIPAPSQGGPGRLAADPQAVRRVDRQLPGAAALRRRHVDRARGGAQHVHARDHAGGEGGRRRTAQGDYRRQGARSEEHTSELQSPCNLVCRLLLEKKKKKIKHHILYKKKKKKKKKKN